MFFDKLFGIISGDVWVRVYRDDERLFHGPLYATFGRFDDYCVQHISPTNATAGAELIIRVVSAYDDED